MRRGRLAFWRCAAPKLDDDIRRFFSAFLPAVIGSAGVQIAMFADTIIATMLPTGSASALYYADRIYQLPLGVIAIAAGTVLLPTMSRHIAAEDYAAAHDAQNRVLSLTLLMAAPFWVATIIIPELVIRAVFERGAFDAAAAQEAAKVLSAYGVGLIAAVSIRSVVASFHARGDTRTPMLVSLAAVAFNILLKLALVGPFGVMGLALATALGATVNLAALLYIADAKGWMQPDGSFGKAVMVAAGASLALAVVILIWEPLLSGWFAGLRFSRELTLAGLGALGGITYGGAALFGMKVTGLRLRRLKA